jgi:glutathione S-transferase
MKLYAHPASTVSRPVLQFIADNHIPVELQIVDIFKGEHYGEEFTRLNPNRLVPLLEDGDFRLSESASILRYLADLIDSPAYPKDLKARARVNEALDWFNANFYRDWGYGLIYPQILGHHKRTDETTQAGTLAWAKQKSEGWLAVLNNHFLGAGNPYLCGDAITIADYFGLAITTAGELLHCDFSAYPNVVAWLQRLKVRPSYAEVYAAFLGFAASTKGKDFVTVTPAAKTIAS